MLSVQRLWERRSDAAKWEATTQSVAGAVGSIWFRRPCSFDRQSRSASEATGFVVDEDRGYILTNGHVAGPGPFRGDFVFNDHEEVNVYPVYVDPIHDFAFLRFDPNAIKHIPVKKLKLRPDLAKVGRAVRVVGNDAGQGLSVLSGVISRLDRNAPDYESGYNDFNTCYYQASAAARGGSSGSPVVARNGHVVALDAGHHEEASTDYFLPLDRPLRVLRCLQEGKPVPRGDIQCEFSLEPFDKCKRLGLSPEWETQMRETFPQETGMLVAETVLPEGPSHGKIEEGDVLIKVNGELITKFIPLDEILDSSVGKSINLLLSRGGRDVEVEIVVGDLHEITPNRFVTVAGASFHTLSYHLARYYGVACKGVYVSQADDSSFCLENNDNLILTIDAKKTPDLDTFIEVVKDIPDRARVVVTYRSLHNPHTTNTAVVYMDRHWSEKMTLAVRNDKTGLWDITDLADPLPAVPLARRTASFIQLEHSPNKTVSDLVHSFVRVDCRVSIMIDGICESRRGGMGLVLDAAKGLVVISRAIVPTDLSDISVTIADSIIVEGKLVFSHPIQNYAILQYDPTLVDAPVRGARLSHEEIRQGASTYFMGYDASGRIVHAATTITQISAVTIPTDSPPCYRAMNIDAISIDTTLGGRCPSGVLVTDDGTVQALWLTFLGQRPSSTNEQVEHRYGLATSTLSPVISQIQAETVPRLRMLCAEFRPIELSEAYIYGVSDKWIAKVRSANTSHPRLFMVKRTFAFGDGTLLAGDILLTLKGTLITELSELDVMYSHEELDAVIVRGRKELPLKLTTVAAEGIETDRVIWFCGALIQRPYQAVGQQMSQLFSQVYVTKTYTGSPADGYGLEPTTFITHVNNQPTPDLGLFIAEVIKIADNEYFRLRTVSTNGEPSVVTMKMDEHYFPTKGWCRDRSEPCGWRRETYDGGKALKPADHDG